MTFKSVWNFLASPNESIHHIDSCLPPKEGDLAGNNSLLFQASLSHLLYAVENLPFSMPVSIFQMGYYQIHELVNKDNDIYIYSVEFCFLTV